MPHQLWSVTKSFLSACVGIALEQGFIDDIDNKVIVTSNADISWDNDQEYPVLELVSDYILSAL